MAYYRLYLSNNTVCVIQMGECDEIDYNQNNFLSGNRFDTEEEAIEYLRENEYNLPRGVDNPYSEKNKNILDRYRY